MKKICAIFVAAAILIPLGITLAGKKETVETADRPKGQTDVLALRMDFLVSLSSDQFNMTEYATNRFGADSPQAKATYKEGDMNTTLIKTAKGKSIMIQHDVANPRPYSRLHTISGTKGFAQKYPVRQLAFDPHAHEALKEAELQQILKEYEHPITKEIGEKARKVGGHGGIVCCQWKYSGKNTRFYQRCME